MQDAHLMNNKKPHLFAITAFILPLAFYIYASLPVLKYTAPPTGDQPFYLMTALSILEDGDLDEFNNYNQSESYKQFYPQMILGGLKDPALSLPSHYWGYPFDFHGILAFYPLNPDGHVGPRPNRPSNEWYSKHGIGLSLLTLPGVWLGKTFPELFSNITSNDQSVWAGALLINIIIGSILCLEIFLLCYQHCQRRIISLSIALLFSLSSPLLTYSLLLFPEVSAALLTVYAFRKLSMPWSASSNFTKICLGIAIGFLPWLHLRFLFISSMLLLLASFRLYQHIEQTVAKEQSFSSDKIGFAYWLKILRNSNFLGLFVAAFLMFVILALYFQNLFGSILALESGHGEFIKPWKSLYQCWLFLLAVFGLLFDQKWGLITYSPILLLSFISIILSVRHLSTKLSIKTALLVALPYFLLVSCYSVWWGEWCPPGRYLTVIMPLLVLPLCDLTLLLWQSRIYKVFFIFCAIISLFFSYAMISALLERSILEVPTLFNHPWGEASLFKFINQNYGIDFSLLFPTLADWFLNPRLDFPGLQIFHVSFIVLEFGSLFALLLWKKNLADKI
jgi:hypothetical protein